MNNEQQQIIDEAYENYFNEFKDEWIKQYQSWLGEFNHDGRPIPQEDFINKIKTDDEFANKWGSLGKIYGHGWRNWNGKSDDELYEDYLK